MINPPLQNEQEQSFQQNPKWYKDRWWLSNMYRYSKTH